MKDQVQAQSRWSMGMRRMLARFLPLETAREIPRHEISDFWSNFNRRTYNSPSFQDCCNLDQNKRFKILIPVDFTVSSLFALDCAFQIARSSRSQVTLLHAVYINLTPYGPANVGLIEQHMRHTALTMISKILSLSNQADIPVTCAIQKGKPSAVIKDYVRQHEVDLTILAPHKHRGLARLLSRKTAETVIRQANCPVLVVNN